MIRVKFQVAPLDVLKLAQFFKVFFGVLPFPETAEMPVPKVHILHSRLDSSMRWSAYPHAS